MKKKKLRIALVAVLAIFAEIFFLPYRYAAILPRRMYTEEDRTMYWSGLEQFQTSNEAQIELCARSADFACKATVLTNGEEIIIDEIIKDGIKCMSFKMLVNDVWFGMPHDQILDIVIVGRPYGDIKPVKGDRIIIFANHGTEALKERHGYEYMTVYKAFGIYIVNPDGRLFSLTGVPKFMAFDGKLPIVLKEHVRVLRLKDRIRTLLKEEK